MDRRKKQKIQSIENSDSDHMLLNTAVVYSSQLFDGTAEGLLDEQRIN